jgi:hypothetical protein
MSIGSNQTPYNIAPYQKPKQEINPQSSNDINLSNPNDKF